MSNQNKTFILSIYIFSPGLKLHGVLQLLKRWPQEARKLLEKTADVKEEELIRFFIPVFSDSEEREEEEEVYLHFCKFVKNVSSKYVC